jgi:hypothetical protein
MPCYEPRDTGYSHDHGYDDKSSLSRTEHNMKITLDRVAWLESALCSVFNELERWEIEAEVITGASRNGLIGLVEFWANHRNNDEARLVIELHKYSKDEQQLLKKILNKY